MTGRAVSRPPDYASLLEWLSRDSRSGDDEFRRIRSELIRIFGGRGCRYPEDLADETIDRVARKMPHLAASYDGEPSRYFYGVAQNIHREYLKRPQPKPIDREPHARSTPENRETADLLCLDRCLSSLPPLEQALILDYYSMDRRDKISRRRAIATRIGLGMNALRIRAYRIRKTLLDCVTSCLELSATRGLVSHGES